MTSNIIMKSNHLRLIGQDIYIEDDTAPYAVFSSPKFTIGGVSQHHPDGVLRIDSRTHNNTLEIRSDEISVPGKAGIGTAIHLDGKISQVTIGTQDRSGRLVMTDKTGEDVLHITERNNKVTDRNIPIAISTKPPVIKLGGKQQMGTVWITDVEGAAQVILKGNGLIRARDIRLHDFGSLKEKLEAAEARIADLESRLSALETA